MIQARFIELAKLLNNIMGEGEYRECPDFEMPEGVIHKTAESLQRAYESGDLVEDENGMLYYSGMIEDYGGLLEEEYEKYCSTTC